MVSDVVTGCTWVVALPVRIGVVCVEVDAVPVLLSEVGGKPYEDKTYFEV